MNRQRFNELIILKGIFTLSQTDEEKCLNFFRTRERELSLTRMLIVKFRKLKYASGLVCIYKLAVAGLMSQLFREVSQNCFRQTKRNDLIFVHT